MVTQGQSHTLMLHGTHRQDIVWRRMRSLPPRLRFDTHRCSSVFSMQEQARLSRHNQALRNGWHRREEERLDGCNMLDGNAELVLEPHSRMACDAHTDIHAPLRDGRNQLGRYSAAPCRKLGPRWQPSTSSTINFT